MHLSKELRDFAFMVKDHPRYVQPAREHMKVDANTYFDRLRTLPVLLEVCAYPLLSSVIVECCARLVDGHIGRISPLWGHQSECNLAVWLVVSSD